MQSVTLIPTPFIGRSQEIAEIDRLLEDASCRLLTLVGPGGIGKTRLAAEAARRKQDSFPGGIYFVQLAPLIRADDILTAIVEATPFHFQQDNRSAEEQFFDYLREKHTKPMLLVLDNFEHLLDGVGIVTEILAATTSLKILVTSREALNLQEEWVRQVSGMDYPEQPDSHSLENFGAVQLFLDGAQRIRGDFDLSQDKNSVVEILRLVEGMPLAIELAVGWLKTLRPADIAQEIRQNMDILATRSRNLPERHRSIRSVFGHSWKLLLKDERDIFQKLAVFRGGFTREAAEVVAGASLYTLAGLVDKSLVQLSTSGRYTIHELLRQYGAEQMEATHQTAAVQRAYIDYYLRILRDLEPSIKGRGQVESLDIIAADFENVRHAWQLAMVHEQFERMNDAVESLHFFGDMRGRYHEVIAMLRAAVDYLSQMDNPQHLATLRRIQARMARLILLGNMRIDFDVRAMINACLEHAQQHGDEPETAYCLLVSGMVSFWEAYSEWAKSNPMTKAQTAAILQQSYDLHEALGDLFYAADVLAWIVPCDVSNDAGTALNQRSLEMRTAIEDRNGIAWVTLKLATSMYAELDYIACERHAREALTLMREIHSSKGILQAGFSLAEMLMVRGDLDDARALVEEMRDVAEDTNNLDGKMMSAGMLAFLVCVMDENYAEGRLLAGKAHLLAQEPFLGGHKEVDSRWGYNVAACGLGDYDAIRPGYASLFWDRHDDPLPGAVCLTLEAVVLAHEGACREAVELLSLAFHQPAYVTGWLHRWALINRLCDHLREHLGAEAYAAAWERGAQQHLETVITAILHQTPRAENNHRLTEPLSERELEVLRLIADGLSNRDIAERLVLSVGTVKVHTRNIYGKLNVNNRTQAIAQASKANLF